MFDKLIGNNHLKDVFKRMIATDRLPHSLLFVGEEGVGKRAFALEIARASVCQNPQSGEACDMCGACKRVDKFNFPNSDKKEDYEQVFFSEHSDVGMVIPYKNNILVDAVRRLEAESNFRPFEAKARFFIINNAEKLNAAKDNAANALLKTLEEPSPTTYIFLITSRPASLLPTIRSRCQTVRFAPIETKQIEGFLENTNQYSIEDAELLSKIADGSIGRALNLDLGKFREQREAVLKVLESLLSHQTNRVVLLKTAEEINDAKNKEYYENYLDILQTLIHDLWTLRLGEAAEKIVNADLKDKLSRLSQNAEPRRLANWLAEIETLRENLSINLNRKIATDALFMAMAS
ncbi:MAG: ATP-binding protein [Pyrinomonadaceae bacterium]